MKIKIELKTEDELSWKHLKIGSIVKLTVRDVWAIKEDLKINTLYRVSEIGTPFNSVGYISFRLEGCGYLYSNDSFKLIKI